MAKYINPYTDFGFKKLFGEEGNKNLLIDFLNQLLPLHHQIKDLSFRNLENLPDSTEERKAFFDIHCEAESGERFIVEMHTSTKLSAGKAKVDFFKDRMMYYLTYPKILNESVFAQAFNTAEVANFSKQQREDYEKSRLSYIGIKQVTETAEKDGLKKGIEQGKIEIAKKMKDKSMSISDISDLTGLTTDEIQRL